MYHYVYRITNTLLNKHYYGKRSSKLPPAQDLGVKYFSSSTDKAFKQDQKDNPQNYRYKVIKTLPTAQEAVLFEMRLHIRFQVHKNSNFYNRAVQTGNGFDTTGKHTPHSEATKRKLSVAKKGKSFSVEHRQNLRLAKLGTTLSDTHRRNIAKANTGKTRTDATKKLLSSKKLGVPLSETHRANTKAARNSDIVNAKLRAKFMKHANIYNAITHELIADNVCLPEWCKKNGYSQGNLSSTAFADEHKAKGLPVRRQHKGIYAKYIQQPKENT